MWPLEHVHLRAGDRGQRAAGTSYGSPSTSMSSPGDTCVPTPSQRVAPWPHLEGAACAGWGMPWPHRNVQGEVSGRLQSQVTENRLTAQTTAYPGLLETGAGHCRRAPCQDAPHLPALQKEGHPPLPHNVPKLAP